MRSGENFEARRENVLAGRERALTHRTSRLEETSRRLARRSWRSGDVSLPIHAATLSTAIESGPTMIRPLRVLAAEDNATNRLVLTKLLDPLYLRVVERGAEYLTSDARPARPAVNRHLDA